MLTPRSAPYTVEDLLELAPQTFLRMSDGSYLLSEHIVVIPGATLRLSAPGGLTLRLASGPDGFATIVSLGGELEIIGEEAAPVKIASWDVAAARSTRSPTDGRAYIRAIGGQFEATTPRSATSGSGAGGPAASRSPAPTGRTPAPSSRPAPASAAANASLLDDVTWQPAGPLEPGQTQPERSTTPCRRSTTCRRSISNVTVDHDAFGLFVSGANGSSWSTRRSPTTSSAAWCSIAT